MIDALTNLKSSRAFAENILTCKHPKLFLIDIKRFKNINLEHSDEGGNFVLCAFAEALLIFSKQHEAELFRLENDQFVLLLDTPFELAKMEKVIFSLCDMLKAQTYTFGDKTIALEVHIGISFDHTKPLEKAQKALIVAKTENQLFVTYSEFANTLMGESEEKIEKMLLEAIQNEQIVLHFQAIVDRQNTVIYYESLIRLECHQGLQSPKLLLKIARERNFYDLLLETISKKIISLAKTQNKPIALNLSSFDLLDTKRVDYLKTRFANSNIIFEIQCDEPAHAEKIVNIAREFHNMGILIALDNVQNTDALEYFEKNGIDFVKIHGDIVRNLSIDVHQMFTCKAILEMSEKCGAKSIATHLNAKSSLKSVQNLPFDFFQGYIFEQPHTM